MGTASPVSPGASADMTAFEDVVEHLGFGRFQWKFLVFCGIGWMADAMEMLLLAFLMPELRKHWGLVGWETGLLGSITFVGMFFGAAFWGHVADTRGRRMSFLGTVAMALGFGLASAFAPSFWWLVAARLLLGFAIGGSLPVSFSYFTELIPSESRGFFLALLGAFWTLGEILEAGIAWAVLPEERGLGSDNWRYLLALSAVPNVFVFAFGASVPESPRYLLSRGRQDEAWDVLALVAEKNGKTLPPRPATLAVHDADEDHGSMRALFRGPIAKRTIVLMLCWFMMNLSYYGVTFMLPQFFDTRGFDPYLFTFLTAVAQFPGLVLCGVAADRWGRKGTLFVSCAVCAVLSYMLGIRSSYAAVLVFAMVLKALLNGASNVQYTLTPEMFPTSLRSTGMAVCSMATRTAGVATPLLTEMLAYENPFIALSIYAAAFLMEGLLVLLLPETRGKALPQHLPSTDSERQGLLS